MSEILELKKEKGGAQAIVKENAKKRGRPQKEKTVVKEKRKKKVKTTVVHLDYDDKDVASSKWKDYKVEVTLIAVRGEMDKEFACTTYKQGMKFNAPIAPLSPIKRYRSLPRKLQVFQLTDPSHARGFELRSPSYK